MNKRNIIDLHYIGMFALLLISSSAIHTSESAQEEEIEIEGLVAHATIAPKGMYWGQDENGCGQLKPEFIFPGGKTIDSEFFNFLENVEDNTASSDGEKDHEPKIDTKVEGDIFEKFVFIISGKPASSLDAQSKEKFERGMQYIQNSTLKHLLKTSTTDSVPKKEIKMHISSEKFKPNINMPYAADLTT